MINHDVTLNYLTLMGIGALTFFIGYTIAGYRAHADHKRARRNNAWFFNDKGQSVVELALMLPLFLVVCFGIVEFGRAVMAKNTLQCAAREGARVAVVRGTNDPEVEARIRRILSAARITPSEIKVTYNPSFMVHEKGKPDREAFIASVRVDVSTDFVVVAGKILGKFSGTVPLTSFSICNYEVKP